MARHSLELAARLLVAWIAVTAIAASLGHHLMAALLPLFSVVVSCALPDLVPKLEIVLRDREHLMTLSLWTTQPIELADHRYLAPFSRLEHASTHVAHGLVPGAILLVPILAWPARNPGEWLARIALAAPLLLATLASTSPLLLAGLVEMALAEMRTHHGAPTSPLVAWVIFLESGGRWLLPLVGAMACVRIAANLTRRAASR